MEKRRVQTSEKSMISTGEAWHLVLQTGVLAISLAAEEISLNEAAPR